MTRQPASSHTIAANQAAAAGLEMRDRSSGERSESEGSVGISSDRERITRGLIAQHATGRIGGNETKPVIDVSELAFLSDPQAPHTVHPALWEQARLNNAHGLFEVAPRLWQVRGYDISNVSFIAGDTGWIVIDPLTSTEAARVALELANTHLGERPVVAVIYTHSHADHFGGVLGVTSQEEVDAGRVRVIAPVGFLHEAVSENLLAGPAMNRRGGYQFGTRLPAGPDGYVDCGLGKRIFPTGISLIVPTEDITHTGEELVVDGVRIVFQLTPETEAPAEMNFYFPDFGWLCTAENCTHTMHNLVPIRGAKIRDSLAWSKYANEALHLYGGQAELVFASHHWPRWGNQDVQDFLRLQRDLYRWMHDQTLRFANHGMTPLEIAEHLQLPEEFLAQGHTRGFYGDLVHNVKAVYQRYLSWYDGNPSRLHPHPPTEAGRRYVEFMGGIEALLAKAQVSFDEGDYRWVAEVMNHAVFAHPEHSGVRELLAATYEQLGYQAQSATFRNAYLTGAMELRDGPPKHQSSTASGLISSLQPTHIWDLIGTRLRAEDMGGVKRTALVHFTDLNERWIIELSNRAFSAIPVAGDAGVLQVDQPDVVLRMSLKTLIELFARRTTAAEVFSSGLATIEGDATTVGLVLGNLDQFVGGFNIIEP
jgi:alkyl sulfatase BDS1-like metallo-beta-lactamase superfamily hydrolase